MNDVNNRKISELPGELVEVEAIVTSNTRGKFKPKVDKAGQIKNTPLQMLLKMKKGARVMLTSNIDVCNNLTNGTMGKILDFVKDANRKIKFVLVIFDDPSAGEEYRKQINFDHQYPGQRATALKQIEFDFQLREGSTSSATATNFPIRLAWGSTCHKIQVRFSIKYGSARYALTNSSL